MSEHLSGEWDYRVKLSFYVPVEQVEAVKAAVFAVGAGIILKTSVELYCDRPISVS